MEDITDRKRAEETHQLLLAATSHDVVNVLNNIMGYAHLLDGRDLPEPLVPRIISLSMSLREIMRELLVTLMLRTTNPPSLSSPPAP